VNWKFFGKLHAWLYSASGGRLGSNAGPLKIALVTTTGRKSGKQRAVPIVSYPYKDSVAVSASNSGQSKHPAWFLNMQANPAVMVQLGTEKFSAIAEVVPDSERNELWILVTDMNPHQKEYRANTDRDIPLVWFRRA